MPVTREDMRVVERVASRFVRRGVSLERDDLVSDGMLVLAPAVRDWEGDQALREEWGRDEFIAGRARRGIIDGLRERNGRAQHGYLKQRFREKTDSLDVTGQHRGGHIAGAKESMLERFVGEIDRDLEDVGAMEMLQSLPSREREIIERSVFGGETEEEIGHSLGISYSRVSQIRSRGLSRLRGENPPMTQEPKKAHTPLSAREVEILQGVADDRTNRELAKRLCVSEETVKSHLRHIHTKLRVSHRAGAVALGFRHGLLR